MKIALVGPIDTPVTKNATAGTEIWTYNFAEELVKRGVEVTLFASSESQFSGRLLEVAENKQIHETGKPRELSKKRFPFFCVKEMTEVVKRQEDFDLIHMSVYSFHYQLPMTDLLSKPVILTLHGSPFNDEDMPIVFNNYKKVNYVFIAKHLEKIWSSPNRFRVIYNGIEVEKFEFNDKKSDYYFWMSRISPEKGVDDAIKFAQQTGSKLIIAGPIRNNDFFSQEVKPHLTEKIQYVGEVTFDQKVGYYRNAKALLMPIKWEEPFGLVVVEAMACGTPVIAYNRGAMPEIIDDGLNGFLVKPNNIEGMIKSASMLDKIDPKKCREKVENNFTLSKMVDSYLDYYKDILK